MKTLRHIILPDTQVKPGVPLDHLDWVGQAVQDYKPDVVVHLGDHWDFPSLSGHAVPGAAQLEGKRFEDDLEAGNEAMRRLTKAMGSYRGRKVILRGNHEYRMDRALDANPKWIGAIGYHLFADRPLGWEVVDYFMGSPQPIVINGVTYAHYFANPNTGKPIGGTITNRLAKIGTTFVQGHVQGLLQGNVQYATGVMRHGIVAGSCLTPDHRVLTADLRYVPLGSVCTGDKLVSFDEQLGEDGKRSRRYKTGTVEAVKRDIDDVFAVTLSSGKVFKVTGDHLWLARKAGTTTQWLRTDQMQARNAKGATHVPILFDEWEQASSFDCGWLSGLYDGEGSLYARTTTGGNVMQLTLAQKLGAVLDRAREILATLGHPSTCDVNQRGVAGLRIRGGRREIARLLGILRPIRLLAKFQPELLARMNISQWDAIEKIEPIGRREIVRIAIDAKTMVVEGYGHHNCYLHDEEYKGSANTHWRGIVVLNEVRDGTFCEMPLTLDYLCRKYEGRSLGSYLRRKYKNAEHRFTMARAA